MTPRAPHDPHVPCVPRGVDGVLSSEERGGLGSANEAKAPPAPRSRPLPWQGVGLVAPCCVLPCSRARGVCSCAQTWQCCLFVRADTAAPPAASTTFREMT